MFANKAPNSQIKYAINANDRYRSCHTEALDSLVDDPPAATFSLQGPFPCGYTHYAASRLAATPLLRSTVHSCSSLSTPAVLGQRHEDSDSAMCSSTDLRSFPQASAQRSSECNQGHDTTAPNQKRPSFPCTVVRLPHAVGSDENLFQTAMKILRAWFCGA